MKAKTLSKGELKAGITEEELLHITDKMLTEYLIGKRTRASVESLINEFERLIAKDHPNPKRTGCPGPEVLRQLASGTADQSTVDHMKQCGPCLAAYGAFRSALASSPQ